MDSLKVQAAAIIVLALALAASPTASASGDFILVVSPEEANIVRGGSIDYSVSASSIESFQGSLSIQVTDLPSQSSYFITPTAAEYNLTPEEPLSLTLTVTTSSSTPTGSYQLNVTAWSGNVTHTDIVTLNILSETLFITVSIDSTYYSPGGNITISGRVLESQYRGVQDVEVSIELLNPEQTLISSSKAYTDIEGYYRQTLTINSDATYGTYIILVKANKTGFRETGTYINITVGSSKPKITITSTYTTDINGISQTVFEREATVIVWAEVENTGGDLIDGLIWVQVIDPNGASVTVMFQVATIRHGEKLKVGFSLTLSQERTLGQYGAQIFVSNKLIAQGGRFLTLPKQTTFTVTD